MKVPNAGVFTLLRELRYIVSVGKYIGSKIWDFQIYIEKMGSKRAKIELIVA